MSKLCRICLVEKPLDAFRKYSRSKDGRSSCCAGCFKKKDAAYRAANPERIKSIRDKWNSANPGRQQIYNKAWYAANTDISKRRSAGWYAKNTERAKRSLALYRFANRVKVSEAIKKSRERKPEKYAEIHRISIQNRRARQKQAIGKLSVGIAERLFALQRGKCACGCGLPLGISYHRDHIMPLALGGTNTDDNIQLLRAKCNMRKHAKHPVEFMQQNGFLI